MKKDILLAGVGGQGILTIAYIIVHAASREGYHFKQSEVHGMSQRGGSVESHLRISDGPVYSDLVPKGAADLILGVEPMEALRQIPYLAPSGTIVTNTVPHKNIPNYPPIENLLDELRKRSRTFLLDAAAIAQEAGNPYSQNVALVGAASPFLGLQPESLKSAILEFFRDKGQAVAEVNLKAFALGAQSIQAVTP